MSGGLNCGPPLVSCTRLEERRALEAAQARLHGGGLLAEDEEGALALAADGVDAAADEHGLADERLVELVHAGPRAARDLQWARGTASGDSI